MDCTIDEEPHRASGGCISVQSTPSWLTQVTSTRATHWLLVGEAEGEALGDAEGDALGETVGAAVGVEVGGAVGLGSGVN